MAKTRNCVICNSLYEYCPSCNKDTETWKFLYCSENCMSVSGVIDKYRSGAYTKDVANLELNKYEYDLSKTTDFSKKYLEEIMAVSIAGVVEEPVVIDVVEENIVETVEEVKEEVPSFNSYKSKKKKNKWNDKTPVEQEEKIVNEIIEEETVDATVITE